MGTRLETSTESTTYDRYRCRLTGAAFVLAPLMWTIAALAYAADIGRNPSGDDSWVEGLIAVYGGIMFIPVLAALGAFVGQRRPRFGILLTVAGVFSAAGTVVPMTMRVLQKTLVDSAVDVDVWDLTEEPVMGPIVVLALLFIVTVACTGVALILDGRLAPWRGAAMLGFAVLFFVAQGAGVAVPLTWPIANVLLLVVLAPLGVRLAGTGRIDHPDGA